MDSNRPSFLMITSLPVFNQSVTSWRFALLFCKLKAYAGTIGTLGELADCLNSSSVANLSFFLKDIGHLLGVKHQTHSFFGFCYVALNGFGSCLEGNLTVLRVISIGSVEWDTIHLGRDD